MLTPEAASPGAPWTLPGGQRQMLMGLGPGRRDNDLDLELEPL